MNLDAEVRASLARGRPDRAFLLLADILHGRQTAPWRAFEHAKHLLPGVAGLLPRPSCTAEHEETLAQWAPEAPLPRHRPPRVGVACFPFVGGDTEHAGFGTVTVTAIEGEADAFPPQVSDPVTQRAAREALEAARGMAPGARWFRVSVDPSDGWQGESWGLAVAMAALSCWRNTPIPEELAFSGHVRAHGCIDPVRGGELKERLLRQARPLGTLMGTWERHGPGYQRVSTLGEAWAKVGAEQPRRAIAAAVRAVREAEIEGDWMQAEVVARDAIALIAAHGPAHGLSAPDHATLLGACVAGANHRTRTDEARRLGAELLGMPWADRSVFARRLANILVTCIDDLDVQGGHAVFARFPGGDHAPYERIHLLGSRASLHMLEGQASKAVDILRENLEVAAPTLPDEVLRIEANLSEALWRAGLADEGYALLCAAIARTRGDAEHPYRRATLAYACCYAARQARRLGADREVVLAWLDEAWTFVGKPRDVPADGSDLPMRLRVEEGLLDGSDALVRAFHGEGTGRFERVILLRMRMLLGDEAALEELRGFAVFAGLSAEEIDRRVVY